MGGSISQPEHGRNIKETSCCSVSEEGAAWRHVSNRKAPEKWLRVACGQHLLESTSAAPLRRKSTLEEQHGLTLLREKPAVQLSCSTSSATFPFAACHKNSPITQGQYPTGSPWPQGEAPLRICLSLKRVNFTMLMIHQQSHAQVLLLLTLSEPSTHGSLMLELLTTKAQDHMHQYSVDAHDCLMTATATGRMNAGCRGQGTLRSCWASSTTMMPEAQVWPARL